MADYQAGKTDPDDPWYGTQAIRAQLELNRTIPEVSGEVHFRYRFLADGGELSSLYREFYRPADRTELRLTSEPLAYIQGSGGLFRPDDSRVRVYRQVGEDGV